MCGRYRAILAGSTQVVWLCETTSPVLLFPTPSTRVYTFVFHFSKFRSVALGTCWCCASCAALSDPYCRWSILIRGASHPPPLLASTLRIHDLRVSEHRREARTQKAHHLSHKEIGSPCPLAFSLWFPPHPPPPEVLHFALSHLCCGHSTLAPRLPHATVR